MSAELDQAAKDCIGRQDFAMIAEVMEVELVRKVCLRSLQYSTQMLVCMSAGGHVPHAQSSRMRTMSQHLTA